MHGALPGGCHQRLKLHLFLVDSGAHLAVARLVTVVQSADAPHFGVAKVKLSSEPGQIAGSPRQMLDAEAARQKKRSAANGRRSQEHHHQNQERSFHIRSRMQVGRIDRSQIFRAGDVAGQAFALGDPGGDATGRHHDSQRQRQPGPQ